MFPVSDHGDRVVELLPYQGSGVDHPFRCFPVTYVVDKPGFYIYFQICYHAESRGADPLAVTPHQFSKLGSCPDEFTPLINQILVSFYTPPGHPDTFREHTNIRNPRLNQERVRVCVPVRS